MSTEQQARIINNILARLDVLEARSHLNYSKANHTPAYFGGTTAGVTTHTAQSGRYIRWGNAIILTLQVAWSAATGTGNARVSLPHTVAASYNFTGMQRFNNVTFANGSAEVLITNNTAYAEFSSPITNGGSTMVPVEAAGNIIATIVYFID